MAYRRHYEIPLLDDIHNYFPAILYEPEHFQNVPQLLGYIRQQMRDRFDLFSAGQRSYVPISRVPVAHRHGHGHGHGHAHGHAHVHTHGHAPVPVPVPQPQDDITLVFGGRGGNAVPIDITSITNQLLTEMMASSYPQTNVTSFLNLFAQPPQPPQQFMEPVPVRATPTQIINGSVIHPASGSDEVCAICQDEIVVGSNVRHLTACQHEFHPTCIDTWFSTNVHCPVCRHDIREASLDSVN